MKTIETKISANGNVNIYVDGKRTSNEKAFVLAHDNGLPTYEATCLTYAGNFISESFASPVSAYRWLVTKSNSNRNFNDGSQQITIGNSEVIYERAGDFVSVNNAELEAYILTLNNGDTAAIEAQIAEYAKTVKEESLKLDPEWQRQQAEIQAELERKRAEAAERQAIWYAAKFYAAKIAVDSKSVDDSFHFAIYNFVGKEVQTALAESREDDNTDVFDLLPTADELNDVDPDEADEITATVKKSTEKNYSINPDIEDEDADIKINHINIYTDKNGTIRLDGIFQCKKVETAYRRFRKIMIQIDAEHPELNLGGENDWLPAEKIELELSPNHQGLFFGYNENGDTLFTDNGNNCLALDINEDNFYFFGKFDTCAHTDEADEVTEVNNGDTESPENKEDTSMENTNTTATVNDEARIDAIKGKMTKVRDDCMEAQTALEEKIADGAPQAEIQEIAEHIADCHRQYAALYEVAYGQKLSPDEIGDDVNKIIADTIELLTVVDKDGNEVKPPAAEMFTEPEVKPAEVTETQRKVAEAVADSMTAAAPDNWSVTFTGDGKFAVYSSDSVNVVDTITAGDFLNPKEFFEQFRRKPTQAELDDPNVAALAELNHEREQLLTVRDELAREYPDEVERLKLLDEMLAENDAELTALKTFKKPRDAVEFDDKGNVKAVWF